MPKLDCDDLLSRHGSRLLSETIVEHWRVRGYAVRAEEYPLPDSVGTWGVRSDLVNGLPQGAHK